MTKDKERDVRINEMLEDIRKQLGKLKSSANNSVRKNDVWTMYAKLEYAILLTKLGHEFETAGGFEYTKFDKTSDAKMLEVALSYLESGKKALHTGSMKSAISDLRKARDMLKLLVLEH